MTRATQHITLFVIVSTIYLALLTGTVPLPHTLANEIIPVLPFWALVSFGAFLLFKLGWGVFTFNDVPEAHRELMKEIDLARTDLRVKNVEVD